MELTNKKAVAMDGHLLEIYPHSPRRTRLPVLATSLSSVRPCWREAQRSTHSQPGSHEKLPRGTMEEEEEIQAPWGHCVYLY